VGGRGWGGGDVNGSGRCLDVGNVMEFIWRD